MKLQLHNSWRYQGDDWWSWAAYLKGPDISKVKSVEYILHPTFENPVRTVRSKSDGFRMETAGWGTFELKAIVHLENGPDRLLNHLIILRKKPTEGNSELV